MTITPYIKEEETPVAATKAKTVKPVSIKKAKVEAEKENI